MIDVRIPTDARKRIVGRQDGSTTRITCAAISNPAELAYAIRFLMDHVTYKASKGNGGGVNTAAAKTSLDALKAAGDSFAAEVLKMGTVDTKKPVSGLGEGSVTNPFNYV